MKAYQKFVHDYRGKKVLIFGLGLIGRGVDVAKLFCEIGCQVTVTDKKSAVQLKPSIAKLSTSKLTLHLGKHHSSDIDQAQVIVRNPDVLWDHPLLERARLQGKEIVMDSALFARYFPGTLVGVTGTRGKTTTVQMIYGLLKLLPETQVKLAGNATLKANLRLLKNAEKNSLAVAELSSWELQGFRQEKISPEISVMTNIYLDHLDHSASFTAYRRDKEAIFSFQSRQDHLFLNKTNSYTRRLAPKVSSHLHWFSASDFPVDWPLRLSGLHNRENAAAADAVARTLGVGEEQRRNFFLDFKGVEHRLEQVATSHGVVFYNDTTSTTPIATLKALEAFDRPIILLVGGNSKRLPLRQLAKKINLKTKAVVLLKGTGTEELEREFTVIGTPNVISRAQPFTASVKLAVKHSRPGDLVLLSPGFTSFAEFNNIFERGNLFKKIIRQIIKSK